MLALIPSLTFRARETQPAHRAAGVSRWLDASTRGGLRPTPYLRAGLGRMPATTHGRAYGRPSAKLAGTIRADERPAAGFDGVPAVITRLTPGA
jgi:hypothetical protein